ncbi:MAG TPA: isoprenylcysteine carboxylmethyltransferase family protein [Polyangia bacterium]|nr:isoprenylcysteine carboxylmethyltransferase family protein [Polyangia bacterium]
MTSSVQSGQGGARVRVPPPLVLLGLVLTGFVLRWVGVVPPPLPFSRTVQLVIGALLAAAGIALAVSARNLFAASGQDPRPWKPSPSLVLRGPYRFTRNPMYVGMFLLQIGIGLLSHNLWIVLLAVATLLIIHYTAVLHEEAYLEDKFGDDYRAFKRRVRRYL